MQSVLLIFAIQRAWKMRNLPVITDVTAVPRAAITKLISKLPTKCPNLTFLNMPGMVSEPDFKTPLILRFLSLCFLTSLFGILGHLQGSPYWSLSSISILADSPWWQSLLHYVSHTDISIGNEGQLIWLSSLLDSPVIFPFRPLLGARNNLRRLPVLK